MALIVKVCSLYTHFGKIFYHDGMLDFVKCFLCIYRDDHVVIDFSLLMWCMTLIELQMSNHSCEPGMNPSGRGV